MRKKTKKIYIVDDPAGYGQDGSLDRELANNNHIILGISNDLPQISAAVDATPPDLILCNTEPCDETSGIEIARQIGLQCSSPLLFMGKEPIKETISLNPYGFLLEPVCYGQLEIAIELAFYRTNLETQLEFYKSHLNQAQRIEEMGSWEWDFVDDKLTWSDNIYRIFGLEPQSFIPTYAAFLDRVHTDDRQMVSTAVDKALQELAPYDIEHRILKKNGDIGFVRELGEVILKKGKPTRMIGTVSDITSRHRSIERMQHLAYHDALTDLPNRTLLMDRLMIQVARAKRQQIHFAVLFIDLDGFKAINDLYGHKEGDKVLKDVAEHLQEVTRGADTVARIGGDEFVALIGDIQSRKQVEFVADKLLRGISREYRTEIDESCIRITASIGIAVYPEDGTSTDELLTNADNAMYAAKFSGKNKVCYFADRGPNQAQF